MATLEARLGLKRESLHPSITETQISELVERFYTKVWKTQGLGDIFKTHIGEKNEQHLEKMKGFWRSVLLRTGEYKGKPVPVHLRIAEIETETFSKWLTLFFETTLEILSPPAAELTNEAAKRIATSLWLSRTNDPFAQIPDWPDPKPES